MLAVGRHHNATKAYQLWAERVYRIPHSTQYHTHWEHARNGGPQNFDAQHRTDSRRPLDQPPGSTTETDKDEDRLTLGTSKVAAPMQLTTPRGETRNLNLHLSCDPEPMKVVAASAAPDPVVEAPRLSRCRICFQTNVKQDPSGLANWFDRRLTTKT